MTRTFDECDGNGVKMDGLRRIEPAASQCNWPRRIADTARIGLAGEIIEAIEPTTEGDPNAILLQLLASIGSLVGNKPHLVIDERRHPLKIWVLVVGATASGKKGTGAHRVLSLLDDVDPTWRDRRRNGIASGEAIVHHIRDDEVRVRSRVKSGGIVEETRETIEGVGDKRLMLKEEEFSRVLRISRKEGSTLSATIREAWDSDVLMTTSKTTPQRATGAHVVIVGHITPEELVRDFSRVELCNGFANRFLFACSRRSGWLSCPPALLPDVRDKLVRDLQQVHAWVRGTAEEDLRIELGPGATAAWVTMKREIEDEIESAEAAGLLVTKVITRGPPYVLRLAALYAVLERTTEVNECHLEAAREIWRYSVDSARRVFGGEMDDADARKILEALEASVNHALTRSEISVDVLGRNRSARELDQIRNKLIAARRIDAYMENRTDAGRPAEWWVLRADGANDGELPE